MKTISKTALAAALIVAVGGVAVTQPAAAKQKKEEQAQPQFKLSNDFRKVAAPAQQALNSGDLATAATGIAAAQAAAKTNDEKYIADQLKLSLVAKQQQAAGNGGDAAKDTTLAAPLEALINNPSTPKDQVGKYAYLRGSIAFEQNKYPDALAYFQKAQAAGYQDPNMPLQIAKAKIENGDVAGGVAELDTVIKADEASGQKAPENLYLYGISKLYKTNDRATTLDWVKRWLSAYPSAENWRKAVYVFGFEGPTAAQLGKAQKLDLYRLMRVTNALADQGDYLQYAQYALDLGLPDEAKTVIAKGQAAGKLSGNSSAASITKVAQGQISQEGSLAKLATRAKASSSGDLASQTADAYMGQDEYTNAIDLYKVALQKGVKDTNLVNLHLGIAQALSGDKASAITQFDKVQPGPDKDVAILWKTWAETGSGAATAAPAASASTTGAATGTAQN
jgi:hypothetical protein